MGLVLLRQRYGSQSRYRDGQARCYVRFHLKEGDNLGGYFGQYSLASSFPNAQQIYVEEA